MDKIINENENDISFQVSTEDLEYSLYLKNQLISFSKEQLIEVYTKDEERYIAFLDTVIVTANIDTVFFFFDESLLDKVSAVVLEKRFDFSGDENINLMINHIIMFINSVKVMDKELKKQLKSNYLFYQGDVRKIDMDAQLLLQSAVYDGIVFEALEKRNFDKLPEDYTLLSSINFLISYIPSIFTIPEIRMAVEEKIDKLSKKGFIFQKPLRDYAKCTKEELGKILVKNNTKEE